MLPSKLDIDSLVWEVSRAEVSHEIYGETRKTDSQVVIAKRLTEQVAEQTFWHELVHAIFATRDLPPRKYDEEEIAATLGPAMYAVLTRNATVTWNPECEAE